jgi:hypothetical protein
VKKSLVWLLGLGLLHGCTVVYKMPDAVPPQTVSPPQAAQSPETPPKVLTISQSIQLCQRLQNNPKTPISCMFKYIDGKPTMFFTFPALPQALEAWPIIVANHTGPFCVGTNAVNRQAQLAVFIQDVKMARVYTCETSVWTDWFSYDQGSNRPSPMY